MNRLPIENKSENMSMSSCVIVVPEPCDPQSGKVILTEENTLHSSPGYQQDGNGSYANDLLCEWYIHAPQGSVRMEFHN